MTYVCTRGGEPIADTRAILQGLSDNGGLYVPAEPVRATPDMLPFAADVPYARRAAQVLALFLKSFDPEELLTICQAAYGRFDDPKTAPVRPLKDGAALLELYHGPTLAFKDMALQVLPRLVTSSARKEGEMRAIHILTATSGDTGKAALEGFRDVPGTRCTVFYPLNGVSRLQERQMVTSQGDNVQVIAVRGNFDDAQTGVKRLFNDPAFRAEMAQKGSVLSSANSINIGCLVPQVAYYFSAYADLANIGLIQPGEAINICVPTGNFGDILAAWYAKRMGLPIGRLICASNRNHVLTDFIRTGEYNADRPFHKTISPSMDILISSNLERLLFELADRRPEAVRAMMDDLKATRHFRLPGDALDRLQEEFAAYYADDADTKATIRAYWESEDTLVDPHTAVGLSALRQYRAEHPEDRRFMLVNATASPYKFAQDVAEAIGLEPEEDAMRAAEQLAKRTSTPLPGPIAALKTAAVAHTTVSDIDRMGESVLAGL